MTREGGPGYPPEQSEQFSSESKPKGALGKRLRSAALIAASLIGGGYIADKVFIEPMHEAQEDLFVHPERNVDALFGRYLVKHSDIPVGPHARENFEQNFLRWNNEWDQSHTEAQGYAAPNVKAMKPAYKAYAYLDFEKQYDLISSSNPTQR